MEEIKEDKTDNRDIMDGGFAVVDRERLIEEETREVTPWYKFFIQALTSPGKMIEECYGQEPYRGASYGIVGCILFTLFSTLISFMNPVIKDYTIQTLRAAGTVAEEKLNETYSFSMISGTITGVIGVFFTVLLSAIIIQIVKAILKDKASFANIYKMGLIMQMAVAAVTLIDVAAAYLIGIQGPVFQLGIFFSDTKQLGLGLQTICTWFSLENIVALSWLFIGYKAITHTTTKKAMIVAIVYGIYLFGMSYITVYFTQMAQQMTGAM